MGITVSDCKTVFLDTAPFIYLFEDHPVFAEPVGALLRQCSKKNIIICTSVITYIEIITLPAREHNTKLVNQYHHLLTATPGVKLLSIDLATAQTAVRMRSEYSLKTADALQVAAAVCCNADMILTNDKHWQRIPDLPIVLVDEL